MEHVGYLIGGSRAVCRDCFETQRDSLGETADQRARWPEGCRLFDVNVKPYRQTCSHCGQVMVNADPVWPEFFTGLEPETCPRCGGPGPDCDCWSVQ